MSLEHALARQRRAGITSLNADSGETIGNDLLLGAGPIAFFVYGANTPDTRRNVYRNVFNLPLFKHGNTVAALKSGVRAAVAEAQHKAVEERRKTEIQAPVKPRHRRQRSSQPKVSE
jgi:hypothetical protein